MRTGVLATSEATRRLHAAAAKLTVRPQCAACHFTTPSDPFGFLTAAELEHLRGQNRSDPSSMSTHYAFQAIDHHQTIAGLHARSSKEINLFRQSDPSAKKLLATNQKLVQAQRCFRLKLDLRELEAAQKELMKAYLARSENKSS